MKKFTVMSWVLVFTAFLILNGCVSAELKPQTSNVWTGDITGGAEGQIKLFIQDVKNDTGVKKITGKILAKFSKIDHFGRGTLHGEFSGKIENNILNGFISGHVSVSEGDSPIGGNITGEMSESKGSGEWVVTAIRTNSKIKGNWTLEKH